ncbi:diaminopimelate decarboxylase [Priestia filamentosa]|uniref:Diaminopimelate decarboxylase n=1 Tax=Priestia filamentosa TaxID=1402861 RepID=A0A1X7D258_9BACI|nr:diaminopimelate decarboxylase [Priestia filamentosa]AKO94018.1 diaminopimelate decarboxylase [Priestia filamentosa]MDT3764271.1 diaminopimelate decarboxylase [Priestia filamentosa]OXS71263.1 diaminopimelate decarboxylase [Priestia filamentosa]RJS66902.1 diaminopimelate decarboxylase [Priestia filamentosa]WCM14897.1 diaminopimelate decarboxylase [Priestia filamentosa]
MFFHGTSKVNNQNHLEIGGVDTIELAKKYGTPLYVYDVALIRQRARQFKETFAEEGVEAQVAYASKAFSSLAMFQLVNEEGLSLDVVSAGELYTALLAGFPKERIHFHGNNKSYEELEYAIKEKIGCIVVDNFHEIALLEELSKKHSWKVPVLLRVTPGIEAHTHDYILTGQEDSKFGFDLKNGQGDKAVAHAFHSPYLDLLGIHCHIGSQIFEVTGFVMATRKLFEKIASWKDELSFVPRVLNLGGGFGIRYTSEDTPLPPSQYVREMVTEIKSQAEKLTIEIPEIWIEPGRSLVGDAGTTLYTVGSRKHIPNVRDYVAVDGGMSDNIRPALYEAKYEAALANRMNAPHEEKVSIAGKCCESGDMLLWDIELPKVESSDILAVFCTGAYGYAMASNYNRMLKPAVVFVENGEAQLVIKRETFEDLVRNEVGLKSKV